jgi:hypothetical protein
MQRTGVFGLSTTIGERFVLVDNLYYLGMLKRTDSDDRLESAA